MKNTPLGVSDIRYQFFICVVQMADGSFLMSTIKTRLKILIIYIIYILYIYLLYNILYSYLYIFLF